MLLIDFVVMKGLIVWLDCWDCWVREFCWNLTKNGDFTICSYYHKLHGSSSIAFPWKGIWKIKAPRHGIGFSREISWDSGALISLTSALCVVATVRQWIICCYIMERLIGCGVLSLGFLGFHGFPRVRCKIVYLVGGIGWGSIHLIFGI